MEYRGRGFHERDLWSIAEPLGQMRQTVIMCYFLGHIRNWKLLPDPLISSNFSAIKLSSSGVPTLQTLHDLIGGFYEKNNRKRTLLE